MISIIIPVYNQAVKLKKCFDSIAVQSYQDYELLVVDDGSNDTIEHAVTFGKGIFGDRIRFFHQENQGANVARNKGFENSNGEYLLFCDADLEMTPLMLEKMVGALQDNPDKSYAYPSHKFGGKEFKGFDFNGDKLREMPYIHTTALIRREHFPGFDNSIKKFQDWDLWLTMLEKGYEGVWISEVLFEVASGGTMSSWLPSIAYKTCLFLPAVKRYKLAMTVIKKKHNLK